MNRSRRYASVGAAWVITSCAVVVLCLALGGEAYAGIGFVPCPGDPGCVGPIATELLSMDLTGDGPLPLGMGFANVLSRVNIMESATMASTGEAFLFDPNPPVQQGDPLFVSGFFDVFFDVTIMDIDPVNDYAMGLPSTIMLSPPGSARMELGRGDTQGGPPCFADTFQPNYGCLPPTGNFYMGHFNVVIDTGVNIGGGPGTDLVKFTVATHLVGNVTNTFISGSQVIDTFNTTLNVNGAVEDPTDDPPFTITLTGPTTASQSIVVAAVPEPATFVLFGAGLLGLLGLSQLRKRGAKAK